MRLRKHLEQHAAEEQGRQKEITALTAEIERLRAEHETLAEKARRKLAALTARLDALEARSAPVAESVPDVPAPVRKTAARGRTASGGSGKAASGG